MILAQLHKRRGESEKARRCAEAARDYFREQTRLDEDSVEDRVNWSRSEMLLENFAEAARILEDGLTKSSDERYDAALTDCLVDWYDATPDSESTPSAERLSLLERALGHSPDAPRVINRLAQFAAGSDAQSEKVVAVLQSHLARGTAPAAVHLLLGTLLADRDRLDDGILHLELAMELEPQVPSVLNNLAWALARSDPPRLDRARTLIDRAVAMDPDRPEIHETRGQILAKQGETTAAIAELETALRSLPDRASLHRTLADLYHQLGQEDLAQAHAQLAETASENGQP